MERAGNGQRVSSHMAGGMADVSASDGSAGGAGCADGDDGASASGIPGRRCGARGAWNSGTAWTRGVGANVDVG